MKFPLSYVSLVCSVHSLLTRAWKSVKTMHSTCIFCTRIWKASCSTESTFRIKVSTDTVCLRSTNHRRGHRPHATTELKAEALDAGGNDCVTKPVDRRGGFRGRSNFSRVQSIKESFSKKGEKWPLRFIVTRFIDASVWLS